MNYGARAASALKLSVREWPLLGAKRRWRLGPRTGLTVVLLSQHPKPLDGLFFQAAIGQLLNSISQPALQEAPIIGWRLKQFAVLARDFFARLTRRHINYYLSRELSKHVGPGRRFPSVREHRVFEDALDLHCRQATRVIKEYSGEWLSKQNYEGGIDPGKAGRYVSYASEKIRAELRRRRNAHVA